MPDIVPGVSGGCCVMCCGCRQFLGKDGQNIDIGLPLEGIIPVQDLILMLPDKERPECADFANAEAANAAAIEAGWQVEDSEGANHRCPSCVKKEKRQKRDYDRTLRPRGAILRFENGRILPEEIK